MTIAVARAVAVSAATSCQKCRRPGGRDRTEHSAETALFATTPLVVCDRCWHAVGGHDAVRSTITADGAVEVVLQGAPEFEALLADIDHHDQRHPIDRLLISSGIRWATLRHIAAPARCDLVRWILERTPSPNTRRATSPDTWIDAVTDLIRQQSGTEFRYNAKRRRWWSIANVFRQCGQWDSRPLTWISQDEVAAAVGCSTRTVRRCVAWLQREGLLHEVLPGCQLPCQATPDDETPDERARRLARRAAAIAAEEAAIARARAELAGVAHATGQSPHDPAAGPADDSTAGSEPSPAGDHDQEQEWTGSLPHSLLVQLVPVYELRVPATAEQTDDTQLAELYRRASSPPLACENTTTAAHGPTNGHPPQVIGEKISQSKPAHPVDNRPASPGIDTTPVIGQPADDSDAVATGSPRSRQSEAARAAQWLLRSRLHPDLCVDVSQRWLATLIRDSRLLRDWDWTWDDLADLIHGIPDYPHLPRWIRNPRGWIKARFRSADGRLSPTKLGLIHQIERTSPGIQRRRTTELEQARRAEIATLRAAITACPYCDELGWQDIGPTDPGTAVVRCNHDPDTAGW